MKRLFLILGVLFLAAGAFAQDRPVVFIHGLESSPATWDAAAGRLSAQLAIQAGKANLDSRSLYESQANQLQQQFAPWANSVVAVGHSNGGVVARQWSRTRPIGGLVTLGSPNQGAPFVDHIFEWFGFLDDVLLRLTNVSAAFAWVDFDTWWWLPAQWTSLFSLALDAWDVSGNGLLSLGFDTRWPVMEEMRSGSAYMANLNAVSNRDREASEVANRVAIVNVAKDFYIGGPFRLVAPDHYVEWHNGLVIAGVALEGLAGLIRVMADIHDQAAFDVADQVGSVGEWFLQFEEVWCRSVSDPSPLYLGRCYEHDGIVPAWSQAYDLPRLATIVRTDGPIHTAETTESDSQLFQALTTNALIPLRSASGSSGSGSSGGTTTSPPPPPPTTGRYKWIGSSCVWVSTDSGPNQCTPPPPPTGRYKYDGWGVCYWEPNDYPPDQCSPPAPPAGRYKVGPSGCYWDPNDDGPNQCTP